VTVNLKVEFIHKWFYFTQWLNEVETLSDIFNIPIAENDNGTVETVRL
jgi:hypothetical protein